MIAPYLGASVLFHPAQLAGENQRTFAGIVTGVDTDSNVVTMAVFNENGQHDNKVSVPFIQDGQEAPAGECYAEWTVQEKSKVAKNEELVKAIQDQTAT